MATYAFRTAEGSIVTLDTVGANPPFSFLDALGNVVRVEGAGGDGGDGGASTASADSRFPTMYAINEPGAPPPDGPLQVLCLSPRGPLFQTLIQLDNNNDLATAGEYIAAFNAAVVQNLVTGEPVDPALPRPMVAEPDPVGYGGWRIRGTLPYSVIRLPESVSPLTASHAGLPYLGEAQGFDANDFAIVRRQLLEANQRIQSLQQEVNQHGERITALENEPAPAVTSSSNATYSE